MLLIILASILALLCALYVLSLIGRRAGERIQPFRGWVYAHRGLHDASAPENSMAAFQKAVEAGYGIELDVHLLADGSLAVMHDSLLARTTGQEGCIEDLTLEDLPNYRLSGTENTIPSFREVLQLVDGKVPLIVELKSYKGNHDALTQAACECMQSYRGLYCMESFDPRCVLWLRRNTPHIVRGQLADHFLKLKADYMPWILRAVMTAPITNFLVYPDFLAYRYRYRKKLSVWLCRRLWGVPGVAWTLQNQQEHAQAEKEGWIRIFENYRP
jgi:glycerophosphoryl diester phosphodiesterase